MNLLLSIKYFLQVLNYKNEYYDNYYIKNNIMSIPTFLQLMFI